MPLALPFTVQTSHWTHKPLGRTRRFSSMPKKKSNHSKGKGTKPTPSQTLCMALNDDEDETRCTQPPTDGPLNQARCRIHHGQYCKLTKRYKDASKVVDEIWTGRTLPTKAGIETYQDYRSTLDEARIMRRYLEAIRVEKRGREIHHRRFFLKGEQLRARSSIRSCIIVDDGHRRRLKVLEKQMAFALDLLGPLESKAFSLHTPSDPAYGKSSQANQPGDGKYDHDKSTEPQSPNTPAGLDDQADLDLIDIDILRLVTDWFHYSNRNTSLILQQRKNAPPLHI